jgi:hypothetical protein
MSPELNFILFIKPSENVGTETDVKYLRTMNILGIAEIRDNSRIGQHTSPWFKSFQLDWCISDVMLG